MSVKINKNYITFFGQQIQQIDKIDKFEEYERTNKLSDVCWYAVDKKPPFTQDLIDVNVCELDNSEFINLLKKIISKCFEIYKDKFNKQEVFLWESVEPNYIFQYNLFRSLLLEYLLAYNFAYVLLREYYSDISKTEKKKKKLENIKSAKLSKNGRIIFDFDNFTFPKDIIITRRISKRTNKRTLSSPITSRRSLTTLKKKSTALNGQMRSLTALRRRSTASRRSSMASMSSRTSRTARNISSLRRNSTADQIIPPNHIEKLIAAGSTSPSSDYDVTLDFECIEGLKINLIINFAFQNFMEEENDIYEFNENKSLGKLFDSNIYSHKTSVSSNHYKKLQPYFLPLEGKSFLLPKKFIETKISIFIMEELRNCLNNDIDKGKTEETILKDLLIYEVDLNSTYNKIAKHEFEKKTHVINEPVKLYKNLVLYLHKCLKHAVEVYEGISTIYHVVYALQLEVKEAINYFETDDYSYRVAFVSAVDNLVHLIHLMNDKDYEVEGRPRPIINSKNVKFVARILHAYKLCEMGIERNKLSKGGALSRKRNPIRLGKQTKKRQEVIHTGKFVDNSEGTPTLPVNTIDNENNSEGTPTLPVNPIDNENNSEGTPTLPVNTIENGTPTPGGIYEPKETDTFYDLGSYNFLMKIKKDEPIELKDFDYPEFKAIKIFILSEDKYNYKETDISYLIDDDFEIFYNQIGYSISNGEQTFVNTRGTKKLLDFKENFYSKKIFLGFIKYKIIELLKKFPTNNNTDEIEDLIIRKLIIN